MIENKSFSSVKGVNICYIQLGISYGLRTPCAFKRTGILHREYRTILEFEDGGEVSSTESVLTTRGTRDAAGRNDTTPSLISLGDTHEQSKHNAPTGIHMKGRKRILRQ